MDNLEIIDSYRNLLLTCINDLDLIAINQISRIIIQASLENKMIYIAGNGGSASTSSHFAVDIGVGSYRRGKGAKAISLTENSSIITATSNDLSFEDAISEQIKLLATKGDILILISASGNSKNLIKSVKTAAELGVVTISLTGFNGGQLKNLTDYNLHFETPIGEYGVVEDLHLMCCHMLTNIFRNS